MSSPRLGRTCLVQVRGKRAQAVLATAAVQREARLFEDAMAGRGKESAQSPRQVMPYRAYIMHAIRRSVNHVTLMPFHCLLHTHVDWKRC